MPWRGGVSLSDPGGHPGDLVNSQAGSIGPQPTPIRVPLEFLWSSHLCTKKRSATESLVSMFGTIPVEYH